MNVRRIVLAGVAGAALLLASATGYAVAGPKHHEKGGDVVQTSQSQQNGNTQRVDVVDVNLCGNTFNVIGAENPAHDNSCTNQ